MTNPNNAVGTNAAYGGRTSVNAFNDDLTIYSRGILSGWACSPKSGMTVQIGGNGSERDAAVAEDNAGNKTSINNISGSPIDVTIPAAPATNNRIDLIVAYADNPPSGTSTVVDNPAACGIIVVSGTAASSPTAPTNATIRSAITADGASGSTAYYVILAQIRVGTGVTTIGSGVITQGAKVESGARAGASTVSTNSIADGAVTSDKIDWRTLNYSVGFGSSTSNIILSASKQAILTSGTLPAGTYLVWGEAYWNITSGHTDAGDLYWGIGVSTNTYEVIKETIGGYSWNKGGRAYACSITLTSSNSIKLYSWRSASNGTVNSVPQKCSMLILRVS